MKSSFKFSLPALVWLFALVFSSACLNPANEVNLAESANSIAILGQHRILNGACQKYRIVVYSYHGNEVAAARTMGFGIAVGGSDSYIEETSVRMSPASASLYSDDRCTAPVSSISMAAGESSAAFYLKSQRPQGLVVAASDSSGELRSFGLAVSTIGASQVVTSGAISVVRGACSTEVQVTSVDSNGRPFGSAGGETILLNDRSSGAFFSDASCTTQILGLLLSKGESSGKFYYRGNAVTPDAGITLTSSLNSFPSSPHVMRVLNPAKLVVSSNGLATSFAAVDTGASIIGNLVVLNSGEAPATGITATLGSPFGLGSATGPVPPCGDALGAGQICTFAIRFSPSQNISYSGTLRVTYANSSGQADELTLPLSGQGILPPGTIDTTFGNGGFVRPQETPGFTASAIQSDGKIVVAGPGSARNSDGTSIYSVELRRFSANGASDLTFGNSGRAVIPLGTEARNFYPRAIAVRADGTIAVTGNTDIGLPDSDFFTSFFTRNGSHISTTVVDMGSANDIARAIVADSANGFYIAGGSGGKYAVIRFTSLLAVDTTFGAMGRLIDDTGDNGEAMGIAMRSSGFFLVGPSGVDQIRYLAYNSDGSRHLLFGLLGTTRHDLPRDGMTIVATTARGDSAYVALRDPSNSALYAIATASDGGLIYESQVAFPSAQTAALAVQADGKLLVAGSSTGRFALARLTTSGSLDVSFGPARDGKVTTTVNPAGGIRSLLLQGNFVVATGSEGDRSILIRYRLITQ